MAWTLRPASLPSRTTSVFSPLLDGISVQTGELSSFQLTATYFFARLRGGRSISFLADTWAGKYENLELALNLLGRGGMYVIDDMEPQPTHGHRGTTSRSPGCSLPC